jgi:hypothetical protein
MQRLQKECGESGIQWWQMECGESGIQWWQKECGESFGAASRALLRQAVHSFMDMELVVEGM